MNATSFRRSLVMAAVLAVAGAFPAFAVGEQAMSDIKGRDGKEIGKIVLIETTVGVLIKVKLSGLKPGPHGIHLHEVGKCEGDFANAGKIYNPLGARHGFLSEEGSMAGDLPNVYAGANGEVEAEFLSPSVTLSKDAEESLLDADGTAFVLFEGPDDYKSDPEGQAGARIGCGVVTAAK